MPINLIKHGNILESFDEVLVNPVNCVGVMGAGLALEFKKKFPHACARFYWISKQTEIYPGGVIPTGTPGEGNPGLILHVATKDHWKDPSRMPWISAGLVRIAKYVEMFSIKSISIPALGCGLGGLPWEEVYSEMQTCLKNVSLNTLINIYEPHKKG